MCPDRGGAVQQNEPSGVEAAARRIALAADDGCFERYDVVDDPASDLADDLESDRVDCEWYRKLARAAVDFPRVESARGGGEVEGDYEAWEQVSRLAQRALGSESPTGRQSRLRDIAGIARSQCDALTRSHHQEGESDGQ